MVDFPLPGAPESMIKSFIGDFLAATRKPQGLAPA